MKLSTRKIITKHNKPYKTISPGYLLNLYTERFHWQRTGKRSAANKFHLQFRIILMRDKSERGLRILLKNTLNTRLQRTMRTVLTTIQRPTSAHKNTEPAWRRKSQQNYKTSAALPTLSEEGRAMVEEESAAVRLRAAASEAAGAMTADRNDLAMDRACMYVRLRKLVGSE